MKLSDWAKTQGISYVTAYRWFKDGKLPVQAYQSDSGTIIVQEESNEAENNAMSNTNNVMSLFLKKTVEFSKNNSSIEDFAAYIISNFSLKPNSISDSPKYSKNKPKAEDVRKHFEQFLKPKGEKPKPNMFTPGAEGSDSLVVNNDVSSVEVSKLVKEWETVFENDKLPAPPPVTNTSIDFDLLSSSIDSVNVPTSFKPTQKEISSANKMSAAPLDKPKKSYKKRKDNL